MQVFGFCFAGCPCRLFRASCKNASSGSCFATPPGLHHRINIRMSRYYLCFVCCQPASPFSVFPAQFLEVYAFVRVHMCICGSAGLRVCKCVGPRVASCMCVCVCVCVRACGVTECPVTTISSRGRGSHLPSHANEAMEVWPEALRDASMRTCK